MTFENLITASFVNGDIHLSPNYIPDDGIIPDADTFFYELNKQCPDYLGVADGEYEYHDQKVYWYLAFGSMYAIIPDYDKMERFDGKWASPESAIEMAQESQHESWSMDKERKEFIKDIQHYISQL